MIIQKISHGSVSTDCLRSNTLLVERRGIDLTKTQSNKAVRVLCLAEVSLSLAIAAEITARKPVILLPVRMVVPGLGVKI